MTEAGNRPSEDSSEPSQTMPPEGGPAPAPAPVPGRPPVSARQPVAGQQGDTDRQADQASGATGATGAPGRPGMPGAAQSPADRSAQDTPRPWDEPQDGRQPWDPAEGRQPWDTPQDGPDGTGAAPSRGHGQAAVWVIVALIVVCAVLLVAAIGSMVSSNRDRLAGTVSVLSSGSGDRSRSERSDGMSDDGSAGTDDQSADDREDGDSGTSDGDSDASDDSADAEADADGSDASDDQSGSGTAGTGGSGSLQNGTDALPKGFDQTSAAGIHVSQWRKIRIGESSGSTRKQIERLLGEPEDVSVSTRNGEKREFLVWRTYVNGHRIRGATVDLRGGHAVYKQIINFREKQDGTLTRDRYKRIAKGQSRQQVAGITGRPDYLARMNSGGTPTETWTFGDATTGGIRFTVIFLRGSVISVSSLDK